MNYRQTRKDFEYLESIRELYDHMTLDGERLNLMQNPTKAYATKLYRGAIELWFQEHGVISGTEKIAKRYGC